MYVDEGAGQSSDPQGMGEQLDAIGASVGGLAAGVASGDVAVNAEGGQALIEALNHMEDGLAEALRDADRLAKQPAIGDTPVAKVLKPFLLETVDGQPYSFLPNIMKFQNETIPQAREAIKKAMENYQRTETDNAQNLNQY